MKAKALFLPALLFCSASLPAQEVSSRTYTKKDGSTLSYQKPGLWRTIGSGPSDWGLFVKQSFTKENLPWLGAIGASTALLIHYDEKIYSAAKRTGRKFSISRKDKTKTYLKIGGVSVFRGPSDLGSAMYFLGDGWINIGLFGYFETYGWLKDDWRAAQTGHQLIEGLLVTGFTTQVIKRVTGRETPRAASAKRGVWRMFPSFKEYQAHRSRYDAVPSGHMATGMMTITVIAENYPDNKYVKPVGYALLTALGFQMVNNGVHWASDYPLGLAVGYGIGKAIAAGGKTAVKRSGPAAPAALNFAPYLSPEGAVGASLSYKF
ncbi:MAG: phosphatase PAP2 family protein [Elusimicrobiota bacterium]|nr:phosphatase PAP2 family protein [Elusimicrobiota bacterium]